MQVTGGVDWRGPPASDLGQRQRQGATGASGLLRGFTGSCGGLPYRPDAGVILAVDT